MSKYLIVDWDGLLQQCKAKCGCIFVVRHGIRRIDHRAACKMAPTATSLSAEMRNGTVKFKKAKHGKAGKP